MRRGRFAGDQHRPGQTVGCLAERLDVLGFVPEPAGGKHDGSFRPGNERGGVAAVQDGAARPRLAMNTSELPEEGGRRGHYHVRRRDPGRDTRPVG
jgi:hypothetical protein